MTSTPPSAPRIVGALCAVIAAGAIFVACAVPSPDVVAGPTRPELMAQGPQPLSADQTLMDFQVETPARPLPGSMPPKYPLQLRTANIGGVVVAKFVVDTTGMPRMSTFEIMKSDHDLFTQAVRASVSEFRFSPAEVGGHKVKQLVQMPFVFSLSTEERDSLQASLKMKRAGAPAPDVSTADDKTAPLVEFVPAKAGRKAMVITATRPERRPPADSVIEVPAMKKPDAPVARRAGRGSVQPAEKPRFALAKLRDTIEAEADPAGSPPPTYPNQLRAANIEGQVHASFVVRANGEVDMTTFRIVKSDHNLFAEAVRKSVPQMRFKPATIIGARVDWVVEMPFIFSLSK